MFYLDQNKHIEKFFKENSISKKDFLKEVERKYNEIILIPGKIKLIKDIFFDNEKAKEFKISFNNKFYRIAFISKNKNVIVFYVTDKILKSEFIKKINSIKFK
ncbi:MAG: hypothetical protein SOZ89_05285 [Peptoniphilaceae bacterium]|nr:hypothetical protein [Peptoniphilaceae bacterium]MDY3738516.1 hypothetical protein [Peptoniphilaceae bacterium]